MQMNFPYKMGVNFPYKKELMLYDSNYVKFKINQN